ncbi:MAG: sigma-70 family RNA polymerase sigma factor [Clostridia bacterium]|nr:sigma-70 family RNA polymerase sigma factor [Clostridia bacterium]
MLALYLAYLDDENDKQLFEDIYYSYRKQMLLMAESILKNMNDSEDAVSTVFLRIAQKNWDVVSNIKSDTDLRNYLLKATKNTALNMIKSKKKDNVSLDTIVEYDISGIENISDDSFLETLCNKIEYDKIVEAIKSLNDKYRDVLYYHLVLDLTVSETAKLLNQSIPTTKKQLVRGKKTLLKILEINGDNENADKQIRIKKSF